MVKYGVLAISHGSRSEAWIKLVDEAVREVRVPAGLPIVSAYLELVEGRLIQDGIDELEALGVTDIVVIPLFISSGSTHLDEIAYALGVKPSPQLPTDLEPFRIRANIHLAGPIDDDPVIAEILYEKLRPLSDNPEQELVLLVGHGSVEQGFHLAWRRGLKKLAARIQKLGGFAGADGVMLLPDQVPGKLQTWNRRMPGCMLLVAPLFLSEGYFTGHVIPERFAGQAYRYNGRSLLPHPGISRWIERQIAGELERCGYDA
ncbi:Sirohydrochlorin ferrochelatase [Paenibacillus sp. UNCCL117]|uniref:sirohydrochlorin chelatase n=1 Tax=unclassified Paenibacillus TaxID=185978 RepID=UPI00088D7A4C|nr:MULTISPECIES: CbiX/SirB N-terminal domain-containing protein [unclassified Paenibacillus]SDE07114.1 Sirohydrochlorin ferrochelatase [Paenibacillus sp. cl123]SFW59233.1 Sirohydrochlorin ferrochelatase [Paenibacillus sp. UNCCL117]